MDGSVKFLRKMGPEPWHLQNSWVNTPEILRNFLILVSSPIKISKASFNEIRPTRTLKGRFHEGFQEKCVWSLDTSKIHGLNKLRKFLYSSFVAHKMF